MVRLPVFYYASVQIGRFLDENSGGIVPPKRVHSTATKAGATWSEFRETDRAPTVHESNVFIPFGLALSERQIPRFIGHVSSKK
jgi:hypothetical protein